MFVKLGSRWSNWGVGERGELDGVAGQDQTAGDGIVYGNRHVPFKHLWIGKYLVHGVDRGRRDTGVLEEVQPMAYRAGA